VPRTSGGATVPARPAARGRGACRGTATWPLLRDDRALREYLAAPDPVWLAALSRARQARSAQRAGPAVRLGQLEVGRELGEPQLRALALAGQRAIYCPRLPGEQGHRIIGHDVLPVVAVRRGAGAPAGLGSARSGATVLAGGPMGADDVGVARVKRQRRLPPAGRPEMTFGDTDLLHLRISFLSGCERGDRRAVLWVGRRCPPLDTHAGPAVRNVPVPSRARRPPARPRPPLRRRPGPRAGPGWRSRRRPGRPGRSLPRSGTRG
jgi:hypothetical protein